MKKLMAFVMIVSIGMFCSLGCTKEAPTPEPQPEPSVETPDATPDAEKPVAEEGEKPAADLPAEPEVKPVAE